MKKSKVKKREVKVDFVLYMIVDFRKPIQSAIIEVHVMTLHYFPFFLSHPKGIWPINEKRIWFVLFLVATDISL